MRYEADLCMGLLLLLLLPHAHAVSAFKHVFCTCFVFITRPAASSAAQQPQQPGHSSRPPGQGRPAATAAVQLHYISGRLRLEPRVIWPPEPAPPHAPEKIRLRIKDRPARCQLLLGSKPHFAGFLILCSTAIS